MASIHTLRNSSRLVGFFILVSHLILTYLEGPLAGSFPLLSLRTNKADVAVGIDEAVADRLDQLGEKWRVDGRYALISFLPQEE